MIKSFRTNLINNKRLVKNRQKGQILIIFLLILVVGLALVLSVASRSITDIRITTTSDESNRAYFAAEAGIEEALKRLQTDSTFSEGDLDFTSINQTKAKIKASDLITRATEAYEFPSEVAKDEVVQISLLKNFNDETELPSPMDTTSNGSLDSGVLDIYWGDNSTTPAGAVNTPAILLTLLYQDSGGAFKLEKYAFDQFIRPNGFCDPGILQNQSIPTNLHQSGFAFKFKVSVDLRAQSLVLCGETFTGVPDTGTPILARIRLLYNDTDWPVAVKGNGWNLPNQGTEVESTGTTTSGVTRKLRVTQQYPALPSIFDYVLFSGGDLTKN